MQKDVNLNRIFYLEIEISDSELAEIEKLINKNSYKRKSPQEKQQAIKDETRKVLNSRDVNKMKKEIAKKLKEKNNLILFLLCLLINK